MSKSNGTGVFIDQSAEKLYGALMALPDPMIEPLFSTARASRWKISRSDGRGRAMQGGCGIRYRERFHGEKEPRPKPAERDFRQARTRRYPRSEARKAWS